MKSFGIVALVALWLAFGLVPAGASSTSSDYWIDTQGNGSASYANLAATIGTHNVGHLRPAWTRTDAEGLSGVLVYNGLAYYAFHVDGSPRVYGVRAVRVDTGRTAWSVTPAAWRTVEVITVDNLRIAGDLLYVGVDAVDHARVTAITLDTHRVAWTVNVSPASPSWRSNMQVAEQIYSSGRLYVLSEDDILDAFDARTGRRLWSSKPLAPDGSFANDLHAYGNFLAYLNPTSSSGFTVLDGRTGRVAWTPAVSAAHGPGALAVVGDRIIYANPLRVDAYPAGGCGHSRCAPLYRTAMQAVPLDYDSPYVYLTGGDADNVYLSVSGVGNDGWARLVDIAPSTGRTRWYSDINATLTAPPVRGGSLLYAFAGPGDLYAYPTSCHASCQPVGHVAKIDFAADEPGAKVSVAESTVVVESWGSGAVYAYRPS